MSQNIGTLISSPIRPNDSNDLIASAFAKEIKGGLHVATASTDRDSIILQRREWGMMCYVINDNQTYQLEYNYNSTNISDNANWKIFSGSGNGSGEWLDSVISIENTEPVTPTDGDRYLLGPSPTGTNWGTSPLLSDVVVQWNNGISQWDVTLPSNGTSVRVDNEDTVIYRYEGTYPYGAWQKEKESQVRYVNALTSNGASFSAVLTPSLSQYDQESLFIVKFNATNGGLTASLDLNSLGHKPILKTNGQSLQGLVPLDISTSYPYLVTYNGTYFILHRPSNDTVSFNVQNQVPTTDHIIVPPNTLYWVYGDLDLTGGMLENYGTLVVTNGQLNLGTGSYVSGGNTVLNSFAEIDGLGLSNYMVKWKTNYILTATSSVYDDGELVTISGNTFSIASSNIYIPSNANSGYVLTSDANGVATWQAAAGSVTKYSATYSLSSGVTYSVSHNLGTNDIICSVWDDTTGELLIINVVRTSTNSIDINSAVSISSARIVVLGG